MYLPKYFECNSKEDINLVMKKYPLATIISNSTDGMEVSSIPLVLSEDSKRLMGHISVANPLAHCLDRTQCLVLFHGPNSFISPKWYVTKDVPTWNYMEIQIHGQAIFLPQNKMKDSLKFQLRDLDEEFYIPDDLIHWQQVIRCFEIEILECKAKFKLSQNRSLEDRKKIIQELKIRQKFDLADWMEKYFAPHHSD